MPWRNHRRDSERAIVGTAVLIALFLGVLLILVTGGFEWLAALARGDT